MNKLIKPGRIIYAVGIIGLGVLCILSKDFVAGRPPVSTWAATIPGKLVWAYVSGASLILAGILTIIEIRPVAASIIAGSTILVFSFVARHLYEMTDWLNAYKALALAGGCFIVAGSFLKMDRRPGSSFPVGDKLVFAGSIFFSLFFIICGLAHFKFAGFISRDFIPHYIPLPLFWTYFCGICLLAAGIGLFIPQIRRWTALLAAMMIAGWFVLLHAVRFAADTSNASDRLGLCESFTFAGMLFVLAGIYSRKGYTQ